MTDERKRLLGGLLAAAVVLLPLGWFWHQSLLPSTYSVMDMGYADYGGGAHMPAHMSHHGISVEDLKVNAGVPADVTVDLIARKAKTKLASGREIHGFTLNGKTPGPTITATVGQLVEVNLHNKSV
ncbi:MAG: multicopper oxidase domain-containing protein, partial [Pseudolysinimonas sp.]